MQGAPHTQPSCVSNRPKRSMKIAIVKERRPHETRVAATPETVKKLKALGVDEIVIEAGAGTVASYTDQAYTEAGAMIVPDAASAVSAAGVEAPSARRPMTSATFLPRLAATWRGDDWAFRASKVARTML